MSTKDFTIRNEGTIYILVPNTESAQEWVDDNIEDNYQPWAGGVVVGHRYIVDLSEGIINAGLSVE